MVRARQRAVVVDDADEAIAAYRDLLDDPAPGRGAGAPRPRAGARRAHLPPPRTAAARARRPRSARRVSTEVATDERAAAAPRSARRRLAAVIAIVPAFNEERNIGRLLDELRALDPGLDVVVVSDGSTDAPPRRSRLAAPTSSGSRSTSASAAPCRPAFGSRARAATSWRYASTATDSTIPPQLRAVVEPVSRGGRHRHRVAVHRSRRLPLLRRPPGRDPDPRARRLADRAPAAHRHDVRLPGPQPPCDRALRRATFRTTTRRSRES